MKPIELFDHLRKHGPMFPRASFERIRSVGIIFSVVGLDLVKDDIKESIVGAEIVPPHFHPEHIVIIRRCGDGAERRADLPI